MPVIYLVEGPVGAGKSTFCTQLAGHSNAVHLNLDAWFTRLFSPDRPATDVMPWYTQRKARCTEQIWQVAQQILCSGASVVLELGLIRRQARAEFYERVEATTHELMAFVLDAERDVRRARVRSRNTTQGATYFMQVPEHFFELASDFWEPPLADELEARRIEIIDTSQLAVAQYAAKAKRAASFAGVRES